MRERGGAWVALEQVVDRLRATVHAELVADRAHQPSADRRAVASEDLAGVAQLEDALEPLLVHRELPVVARVEHPHRLERRRVDVVDGAADGRQPTGEERRVEAVGEGAEVVQRAEPAEGLAEHAPPVDAEVLAEGLGVAHDRVRAEVGEPLRVRGGVGPRSAVRRGAAGAALVEHQHPVVAQGTFQPGGRRGSADRARRLLAGTALEEHQERTVTTVRSSDLAGEDLDGLAVAAVVVEGQGQHVVGEHRPGDGERQGHPGRLAPTCGSSSWCRPWAPSTSLCVMVT